MVDIGHDNALSVFVSNRKQVAETGLFQWVGSYENMDNNQSDNQICWKYAILSNDSLANG